MRPPVKRNPDGRVGAGEVDWQSDYNYFSRFFLNYQAYCHLFLREVVR